ncbi:DUF751 family protein [Synechococcus sp. PCC 7336]|uniref:DUF751 family protein n=1 Tax=Synechococcus sp. PCC 7336 TaxID=195250 RepID=UPI0003473440|nr:DUF751 family protein [Synechococcus sp. PCC 7336]
MAEKKLEDRFIENVSRYPLYVISVMVGGLWVLVKPLAELYKKSRFAAIAVTLGGILAFLFVTLTLRAMMGETWLPSGLAS